MDGSPLSPRTWARRALEAGWLAAAIGVPLAFNPWGYNGFELPKVLLLRALVLLMGMAGLVLLVEGQTGDRPSGDPVPALVWAGLAFGLAAALATLFSTDRRISLWGSYQRQQGLLTLAAYVALFVLTAGGLRRRAQVRRLWAALVWTSGPVVAYGLFQATGLDPLEWQTDAASSVLSTVGRANFLGSYLVVVIPLTAGRLLAARRRWPLALLLAGQVACLILTQARSAWAGLAAAVLVFGLSQAAIAGDRRLAGGMLILALLAGGLVALLNRPGGPLAPLAHLPGLDRLAGLAHTDAGSIAARITIWRASLPLLARRPLLGYGPETMRAVFMGVFPPQLVYYQGRHVAVDRAHNLWVDLGMSAGLAGVLAFGLLVAAFGRSAWRGLRSPEPRQRTAWIALVAAVAGHLADLQFSFDLTTSATAFWLTLALAVGMSRTAQPDPVRPQGNAPPAHFLTYLPPILAALVLAGLVCLRPLLADGAAYRSRQPSSTEEARRTAASRAVRLWPLEPEYHLYLAWLLAQGGNFTAAEVQLDIAQGLLPGDPRGPAAQGEMYALWGQNDPARFTQAEAAYRRALGLAPNVATYHTSLGLVLAQQGHLEEGVAELERAVDLDATDGTAYGHLAGLYRALGREAEATWAWQQALKWSN